jgi:Dehydratase family
MRWRSTTGPPCAPPGCGVRGRGGFLETCLGRGLGACNTMGTASTMAIMAETLGLALPGSAVLASGDARQSSLAEEAGRGSCRWFLTG